VTVLSVRGGKARIGITAPDDIAIWRSELLARNKLEGGEPGAGSALARAASSDFHSVTRGNAPKPSDGAEPQADQADDDESDMLDPHLARLLALALHLPAASDSYETVEIEESFGDLEDEPLSEEEIQRICRSVAARLQAAAAPDARNPSESAAVSESQRESRRPSQGFSRLGSDISLDSRDLPGTIWMPILSDVALRSFASDFRGSPDAWVARYDSAPRLGEALSPYAIKLLPSGQAGLAWHSVGSLGATEGHAPRVSGAYDHAIEVTLHHPLALCGSLQEFINNPMLLQ
jgi:hypothetical protein